VAADELVLDPGVLAPTPTLEFGGHRAAAQTDGVAILPWRSAWLAAEAAGVRAHPRIDDLQGGLFEQALVHLQKSRDATWCDLAAAHRRLAPGGRLLLCGGNELGVVSAVKRLARELDQPLRVLANRRHARIALFDRGDAAAPAAPATNHVAVPQADGGSRTFETAAGVFSARKLDAGSALILEALYAIDVTPKRILDLGCGIGTLALSALLRWPDAEATLLDADVRAIDRAADNARTLGLAGEERGAMRRQEKVDNVGVLREEFSRAKVAVVADYRGLTAGQFDAFRSAVRAVDGRCRVAKNRLAKRAIEGTAYTDLEPFLQGPTALILGFDDPVAVAKAAVKFAGDIEALEIRGAVLDGAALPPGDVKALADLPPLEVLQAQLLAVMQAPATQLVRLLSEPGTRVVRLVKAIADRGGEQ